MKLKRDEPLLNVASDLNVRRYDEVDIIPGEGLRCKVAGNEVAIGNRKLLDDAEIAIPEVRCCKSKPSDTRVESAGFHRLNLKYDKLHSNFAVNLHLRHYTEAVLTYMGQGLTFVHVRAQLEQLKDTFMG